MARRLAGRAGRAWGSPRPAVLLVLAAVSVLAIVACAPTRAPAQSQSPSPASSQPTVGVAPPAAPSPSPAPTSPAARPPAPTAAQPTQPPPPSGPTAGELASAGKEVYAVWCAACHGDQGQGVVGPALIGPRANPAKFGPTASDLHGYIRLAMPQNAPGSLSAEQYLQVTSYLLVQNALVGPGDPLSESSLPSITVQR